MGQVTSATMGQSLTTAQEERMKKRIRQTMGTFSELGAHIKQANDWARLCPTPKTCYLSFRIVLNERLSLELLPYVWKIRGNVQIEVRKLRRRVDPVATMGDLFATNLSAVTSRSSQDVEEECIGQAKVLTVRQFYYVYCFLSDVKACAAHTVQFPEREHRNETDGESPLGFDDTECQICMDKQKQVVLPCTHSFCLNCFQHWSAQNNTCPICRSKIECSEGSDLWQLTSHEVKDIGSYATDLVARIFEFLEKRDRSEFTAEEIQRSAENYATASAMKYSSVSSSMPPSEHLLTGSFPLGLSSILGRVTNTIPREVDADFLVAMELASGEDQFAAFRRYEQMRRDQVLAMAIAMQVEDEEGDDM